MWGGHAVQAQDRLDRRASGRVLVRTLRMLRPYRGTVALAAVAVLVFTGSTLAGPVLVRHGIDAGIDAGDRGALGGAVGGYLVATVLLLVSSRQQQLLVNQAGERFLRDLRIRVFDHLIGQPLAFFDRNKAGVLVSRMTSDVDAMSELVQFGLLQLVSNAVLLVVAVVLLAVLSWELLLLCLVALPLVIVASVWFQRASNTAYLDVRDHIGQTLSSLQEGISGVRVVQAYAQEDARSEAFRTASRRLYRSHMRTVKISVWYFPVVEFAGAVATAMVVGVGGVLVHRGDVSLGTVVAFVLLLANLFEPVQQLSMLFNTLQSSGAALAKLYALIDTPSEVGERPGAVDLPVAGALAVVGVGFGYEGAERPALTDATVTVAPGERIALVGPTGAGKSTLAKLMARFYDPSAGTVTFGGVDLRSATLASLRRRIVVVPQEGYLFTGTIRDNVRLARPDASDDEVSTALDAIGALERFLAFPEGLDTEVRERGSRLSAGERQLVSLARAALVDPAVLVLDEATSSLDPGTELAVEQAVERLSEGRTVIAIAHRLSTAERADRVVVVDGGRIVEVGHHRDLVGAQGAYTSLHRSWVGPGTVLPS